MTRGDKGNVDLRAGNVAFPVIVDRWIATRTDKARSTRDCDSSFLRSLIVPTFGDRTIKSVRPSELEAWLASMDKAPNTKGSALQILRNLSILLAGTVSSPRTRPPM